MPTSQPLSILEAVQLFLEWARNNHLGPLQTVSMVVAVAFLWGASRFIRSAKRVVGGVHSVYEQALEDQKQVARDLRHELQLANERRRLLADELESQRRLVEDLLRDLAKHRAHKAQESDP